MLLIPRRLKSRTRRSSRKIDNRTQPLGIRVIILSSRLKITMIYAGSRVGRRRSRLIRINITVWYSKRICLSKVIRKS